MIIPKGKSKSLVAHIVEAPDDEGLGQVLEQEFWKAWHSGDASFFASLTYELKKDRTLQSPLYQCYLWILNRRNQGKGEFRPGKKELAKLLKDAGIQASATTIRKAVKEAGYKYPGARG